MGSKLVLFGMCYIVENMKSRLFWPSTQYYPAHDDHGCLVWSESCLGREEGGGMSALAEILVSCGGRAGLMREF